MGSVVISGATSGAITLAVPAEAGTHTVTIPAATGQLLNSGDLSSAGDTAAGNAAAVGYTAAEGLILTGQGSTSDVTIKNDADATVLSVATGTGNVGIGKTPTNKSLELYAASNTGLRIQNSTTGTGSGDGFLLEQGGVDTLLVNYEAGVMKFLTSGTERMRISADGNVDVVGVATAASFEPDGDTAAGDNAAIGYTSAEGLILTGQGSTSDVTIKNDADATVMKVPTGTTNVDFLGQVQVNGAGTGFSAGGINLEAAGSGYIVGTSGDGVSSTVANVKIASWQGIGFAASISGQTVPLGENAAWINARNGAMSIRSTLTENASDERLKENFEVIPNALEKISSISGYTFDWKMDKCVALGFEPAQTHEHGVIAQEIKEILPDAVTIAPFDSECGEEGEEFSKSGENYLTVNIRKLIPLLLQGIKEQQTTIEALEARITALEA